jgi:hypothetical protein
LQSARQLFRGADTPTAQSGALGTLNSETLTANSTAMKVDARVNATVSGTALDGLAQGMAIMPRGEFGSDSTTISAISRGAIDMYGDIVGVRIAPETAQVTTTSAQGGAMGIPG